MIMMTKMFMKNLLSCALRVHPEPDCVDRDTDHGGARHHVAESMRPPGHHHHHHHHRQHGRPYHKHCHRHHQENLVPTMGSGNPGR